ncbi:MAG: polysaccharide deacetylase family protein [Synergistota bacterium]|nr:polysaccharide deacetylase family protein [Synergistota bacterium]
MRNKIIPVAAVVVFLVAVCAIGYESATPTVDFDSPEIAKVIQTFAGKVPNQWGQEVAGVVRRFEPQGKQVALTFDACGGPHGSGYDKELINFLRSGNIAATLFINARWLEANPEIFAELASDPLFTIANHGLRHRPCSMTGRLAYGIKGTTGVKEVIEEIEGGAMAVEIASGDRPRFYRSGTNHYDEIAVRVANALRYSVVGYSVNGDGGATFSAEQVKRQLLSVKPGGIVLMHMNHPEGKTAEGVMAAVPLLREQGFSFAGLEEVLPSGIEDM